MLKIKEIVAMEVTTDDVHDSEALLSLIISLGATLELIEALQKGVEQQS